MKKIIVLSLLMFSLIGISACTTSIDPKLDTTDLGLAVVRDYDELKALISVNNFYPRFNEAVNDSDFSAPGVSSSEDASDNSFSKTNVQVDGVDEGDIIKTDGNRIYRIDYNRLIVVDVDGLTMNVVLNEVLLSTREENSYTYYSDLYVTDTQLVVIGQRYDYYLMDKNGDAYTPMVDFWYYYGLPQVVISLYDLETLSLENTIEISGYYQSTRLIGDMLYVLTTQDVYTYNDAIDPRPVLNINEDTIIPSYEDIKYIPESVYESFTIITTVPLESPELTDMSIYLGASAWGQMYVSLKGIYFASTMYRYDETTNTYTQEGLVVSYVFNEDGSVFYGGKASYAGYILNQFAIDEYEGYLRLVTTDGWGDSVKNRLYIFKHERELNGGNVLSLVSLLDEGIGKPRERVQSARFNETMVTVVTFEQTDPLYIIDLTNPNQPKIASEIEVTGFGTYQHPWGDGRLLVIGYETNLEGRIIGLKVSFFDTSDRSNIQEIGNPYVILNDQNGWSYSEALHNHKAMLIDIELGIFGFSTSRYQQIITTKDGFTSINYQFINNYIVFNIQPDALNPIQFVTELTHSDILTQDNELSYYSYYWAYHIDRAVYINDTLYTISQGAIKSHDMTNNYETGSVIVFDQYMS